MDWSAIAQGMIDRDPRASAYTAVFAEQASDGTPRWESRCTKDGCTWTSGWIYTKIHAAVDAINAHWRTDHA